MHVTHTHLFYGALSRTIWVSWYQKGKTIWILLKQEIVSGSGISWAICKSAPCSKQITMPTPHHSVFSGRILFLPPNQQCLSTEGHCNDCICCNSNEFLFCLSVTLLVLPLTSSSLSLVGRRFGCFVNATLTKLWKFWVLQTITKPQTHQVKLHCTTLPH